mmetsp:Transcript_123503/g.349087  ORF Transcript_123503/g.349087 Transcript_123503/m.349087 type:complete len:527 (+) Transcript_123503:144-1724(+)
MPASPPTECDFGSYLGPRDRYSYVLDHVDARIGTDKSFIETLLRRIDDMWMWELEASCSAEFYTVVKEAAVAVESGAAAHRMVDSAEMELQEWRSWALESLAARFHGRQAVALDGGFDVLEQRLVEHCEEVTGFMASLLRQLLAPTGVAVAIRALCQKAIDNLREEHESVEMIKYINMEILMNLDEDLSELLRRAWVFAAARLSVARRTNSSRKVVQTWLLILDNFKHPHGGKADYVDKVTSGGAVADVLRAMELHPLDGAVLRDSCAVVALLADLDGGLRAELLARGGGDAVRRAVGAFPALLKSASGADALRALGLPAATGAMDHSVCGSIAGPVGVQREDLKGADHFAAVTPRRSAAALMGGPVTPPEVAQRRRFATFQVAASSLLLPINARSRSVTSPASESEKDELGAAAMRGMFTADSTNMGSASVLRHQRPRSKSVPVKATPAQVHSTPTKLFRFSSGSLISSDLKPSCNSRYVSPVSTAASTDFQEDEDDDAFFADRSLRRNLIGLLSGCDENATPCG